MFSSSLRWSLSIPILLAVFVFAGIYTSFWANRYIFEIKQNFNQVGEDKASIISKAVIWNLWDQDQDAILKTLKILKENKNFVFAEVFDQKTSFLRMSVKDTWNKSWKIISKHLSSTNNEQILIENNQIFIKKIVHPRYGTIGHIALGFSRNNINQRLISVYQEAALIGITGFVIFGAFVFIVALSVARPITRAAEMIDQVAKGNLDVAPIDLKRQDEVGKISKAVEVFAANATQLIEVQARAAATSKIAEMAHVDYLTNLPNRRALDEKLYEFLQLCIQDKLELAILHIDLDNFKPINDTLGHAIGDKVLQEVSDRLLKSAPEGSFVARVGGDEFAISIIGKNISEIAENTAKNLIQAVTMKTNFDGQMCRVGCSVGIAIVNGPPWDAAQTLVDADIALYRAKAEGKNRYKLFTDEHKKEIKRHKALTDDLLRALENYEFIPYFQPQVDSKTYKIVGAEALVRWDHPEHGILAPFKFLETAEELGIISAIDKIVYENSYRIFSEWGEQGIKLPSLSVNVSSQCLYDENFIDQFKKTDPTKFKLNVELVETIYLDDANDLTIAILDNLRDLGIGIEIDDFGTGHSSVAGLLKISPDRIKIDRQFVTHILEDKCQLEVLKLFVQIGSTLGIKVLAEGVETIEHAKLLHNLGCDILQGYYFSAPVAAKSFREMLIADQKKQNTLMTVIGE